jgi:glutathione S-transferase
MIRLLTSFTSPFGRKVRLCASELGVTDRIEIVPAEPNSPATVRENPLGKVPALVLEDGTALIDSRVICEYLDQLAGGHRLFPAPGPARWLALRQQALADGMCDATVLCMQESRRPANLQSAEWVTKQLTKVRQALATMESAPPEGPTTIGTLATLSALGYLDFRLATENWRANHPRLAAWFARASDRDDFRQTMPPA